jgi:hypothetical protein
MAGHLKDGPRTWRGGRDEEGYREFFVRHLVYTDSPRDGPYTVMNTPGLPLPGAPWAFDNDLDPWAFCKPDMTVTILQEREGDPNIWWAVDQTFTTKPLPKSRCQEQQPEDPMQEPMKFSGSLVKYTEEATFDRFNQPILTSSHEQIRGPVVEFDRNRPTLRIEQNVLLLELAVCNAMVDTVNDAEIWGYPRRCVKLGGFSWEEKYYGTCYRYYTRVFDFEFNANTFDREAIDEGTKVLHGRWNPTTGAWQLINLPDGSTPDHLNPSHFIRATDRLANPIRMVLNGEGVPAETSVQNVVGTGTTMSGVARVRVEKYDESNFLLLGLPPVI